MSHAIDRRPDPCFSRTGGAPRRARIAASAALFGALSGYTEIVVGPRNAYLKMRGRPVVESVGDLYARRWLGPHNALLHPFSSEFLKAARIASDGAIATLLAVSGATTAIVQGAQGGRLEFSGLGGALVAAYVLMGHPLIEAFRVARGDLAHGPHDWNAAHPPGDSPFSPQ
jgi:hypothetical protein